MNTEPPPVGLRERKKRAMRARLSDIALRLALERGVSQVRIEDIASEADVSPRTFNNYFSSKEAAIVGGATIRAEDFCGILKKMPAELSLHDALRATAIELFTEEPDRDWIARARLIRSEPSLFAEAAKADRSIERTIATEIGHRTGNDPTSHFTPRLAAAVTIAAMHVAVEFWLDSGNVPLREIVGQIMAKFHVEDIAPAEDRKDYHLAPSDRGTP
ncbi:TetR/AcrR family transcriptional regulator [Mesobaculum littorinae]|nr:TetR family transcriptional regulator [Mesobaculum littorinae]